MRYDFILTRMANIKITNNAKCGQGSRIGMSCITGGNIKWSDSFGKLVGFVF